MTFFEKTKILFKSRKIFKNWIIFPLSYYNLIFSNFIIFRTRNNKTIKIRKNSTDLMALINVWLLEEYKKPNCDIKSDDIIIDIGAHIGLFTVYASQFCERGKIFAIEPKKENYDLLLVNIKENNLKQVKAYNCAVSQSNTFVKLYINEDDSGHSLYHLSEKYVKVESITLQKILEDSDITNCNLLKLDCEGAEYEILKSLPTSCFEKIEKIIMEYHMADSQPELIEELKKNLMEQNYKINVSNPIQGMGILYAIKNSV